MSFDFPVLVCDVGGTNARFALKVSPEAKLAEPLHVHTGDYRGLADAIASVKLPERPRSVIACGAGPIVDGKLKLSNAEWVMEGREIAGRLKLSGGLLLNDFEAQALSLPVIPDAWTRQIGPLGFRRVGPQAYSGAGNRARRRRADRGVRQAYACVSSEFPHMGFGPATEEEAAIWPHLERAHGRITTESVASGAGLARVYRARLLAKGATPPLHDPAAVTAAALADPLRRGGRGRAALLAHHRPARR